MKPMISLTTTAETEFKQLDKDKASILWELLGLLIAPEYDDFFDGTNPQYYASDSWDFYGFFYDVLLEKIKTAAEEHTEDISNLLETLVVDETAAQNPIGSMKKEL